MDTYTLKRNTSNAIPIINLKHLEITPVEYVQAAKFIQSLGFPEATDRYLKSKEDDIGIYLYTFKLKYHDQLWKQGNPIYQNEWFIRKRVHDFQELEKNIKKDPLFHFKNKDIQKETQEQNPEKVLEHLFTYLQTLIQQTNIQDHPPHVLLRFLELSYINYGKQTKFKECFLSKKAGGRYGESKCARCGTLWGKWDSRYFIISSESVMYAKGLDRENCVIREVLNFDYNFTVKHGLKDTGHEREIILKSSSRRLQLIAPNLFEYFDFLARLQEAIWCSPYTSLHRFDSFAPERQGFCKWYISGQDYFSDLYKSLLQAKTCVYITDWWLSPQFYLQRPVGKEDSNLTNRDSRLDLVLKNIADRGVQILIIVWQEPSFLLNNDSYYTKTHLESLSPNIKVYRHPNQIIPVIWSHHEKMVVIDQKIGFMGGLDLCFGRMDNKEHSIFDYDYETSYQTDFVQDFWPGIDYSNSRVKDFINVKEHWVCLIEDKRVNSRLPWQDIALQVIGDPVVDLARHFIQYWNFVTIETNFKKRTRDQLMTTPILDKSYQIQQISTIDKLKQQFASNKVDSDESPYMNFDENMGQSQNMDNQFLGQDFKKGHFNAYVKKLEEEINQESSDEQTEQSPMILQEESKNQDIELGGSVIMPQQDIVLRQSFRGIRSQVAVSQSGHSFQSNISKQNPRRLSQAIQGGKQDEPQQKLQKSYFQMIKQLQNAPQQEEVHYPKRHQKITHQNSNQLQELDQSRLEVSTGGFIQENVNTLDKPIGTAMCQLLRSSSRWSIGCKDINREMSIQVAYIQLIAQSKKYIYIENQFFISQSAGRPVENQISNAIVARIKQAAQNQERFKIIVVLPLLPGFEGEIDDAAATVMKIQLHWEYATICRGGTSILEQLSTDPNINDPFDYIEFYSLRQHAKSPLNNEPKTEIVYVHSKLMIVDDEIALIGSANINDRSLMGSRDSEIAMVIYDQVQMQTRMGGQVVSRSKFAHTLRTSLYQAHFGLNYGDVIDPLSLELQVEIRQRTKTNTLIYREIFACYPDDTVLTLADYDIFKRQKNLEKYDELSTQIKGQGVEFPLKFLEKENLRISIFQKEYLCPEMSFT